MQKKRNSAKQQKRQAESSFLTPDFLKRQKMLLEAKLTDCRKLQKLAKQEMRVSSSDERKGDVIEQALTYGERQIAVRQLEECGKITSQVIWALHLVNNLLAGKKKEEEYGKCTGCQGQIPERRLIAAPWAERCVPCQQREDAKK